MSLHKRKYGTKRTFVVLVAAGALALSACGGSDDESSDTTVATQDSVADDTAGGDQQGDLAKFCEAANDADSAADLPDSADAAAVAEEMGVQAQRLTDLVDVAPAEVKGDIELLAKAATDMSAALADDPTLENFDAVVGSFATEEVNDASTNIETFLSENCGAAE